MADATIPCDWILRAPWDQCPEGRFLKLLPDGVCAATIYVDQALALSTQPYAEFVARRLGLAGWEAIDVSPFRRRSA